MFTLVLGVCLIIIGCPMTWYGASQGLTDFLVMGPQAIIIGLGMVIVALALFGRDIFRMKRRAKVRQEEQELKNIQMKKLMIEYNIPECPEDPLKMTAREPTADDLYGTKRGGARDMPIVEEEISSMIGDSNSDVDVDGLDAEINRIYGGKAKNLPAPSLAYPTHGGGGINGLESGIYVVPIKQTQVASAAEVIDKRAEMGAKNKARKASLAGQKDNKDNHVQKLPMYDLPGDDLSMPVRELTVTDLYGSPDATDFGSVSGLCTPATGVTELDNIDDELDDDIESEYGDMLKEHPPPEAVHVNVHKSPPPL